MRQGVLHRGDTRRQPTEPVTATEDHPASQFAGGDRLRLGGGLLQPLVDSPSKLHRHEYRRQADGGCRDDG